MQEENDKVIIDLDEGKNLDSNLDLNQNVDEAEPLDLNMNLNQNVDEDENISIGKRLLISIWFSIKFWVFIALIFGIHSVITYSPRRHSSSGTRQKACYSNIRVIQGAVEMYNMDNETMMTELDQKKLRDLHYIKSQSDLVCPYSIKSGSYSGQRLHEDGEIICSYHGGLIQEGPYDKKENNELNIKEILAIIGILSIPTILRFCWTFL